MAPKPAPLNLRLMVIETERLKTFSNWSYNNKENILCTADKMSKAGFYTISESEPDTVKCFICAKQLDGWEPDDDPLTEHEKHAPYCTFVKFKKLSHKLTLSELITLSLEMELQLLDNKLQDNIKATEKERDKIIHALLANEAEKKK